MQRCILADVQFILKFVYIVPYMDERVVLECCMESQLQHTAIHLTAFRFGVRLFHATVLHFHCIPVDVLLY
jgi:hypothetical protein